MRCGKLETSPALVHIVAHHSKFLMQASPLYTSDLESATAVLAYDYCHMSWLVAAGFGGESLQYCSAIIAVPCSVTSACMTGLLPEHIAVSSQQE